MTPFDWQEGMNHRAQFAESRIAAGVPVVAYSLPEGIFFGTFRSQVRKVYEVYDRLIFTGIGMHSDIESIRVAAVDFAHQEGYQRSEDDVTIQRVVSALSNPVKKSFGDFQVAPLSARCLFAEVNEDEEKDKFYTLDFDGDYEICRTCTVLAGTEEAKLLVRDLLESTKIDMSSPVKVSTGVERALKKYLKEAEYDAAEFKFEAAIIQRASSRKRRFQLLTPEE